VQLRIAMVTGYSWYFAANTTVFRVRFLRHRTSSHYCCYGNHAAGSKPV